MEFILIVKSKGVEPTPQDMQKLLQNYTPWMQLYTDSGNYVAGSPFRKDGALLTKKGECSLNGNFLKGANLITGYIHLVAESLDAAIQITNECPLLEFNTIVVMPILEMK
ncbi:YciI family protein [Ulvibacterium marinum]|uniref:YciI family protein n=1 Tax=Ulvibacterium marinum TaxID=2419782 RepID=UPI00249547C1|nr:YciI family protein [Ulvibacterium marinum]